MRLKKGDKALSQSDIPANGKKPPKNGDGPFDGYDDVAEGITEPHSHPKIPTSYKPGTGRRLITFAVAVTIALAAGYVFVSGIKANDEDQLAASTEAKLKAPPTVEVVTVTAAADGEGLRLPAEARGWYNSTIYARVSGYLKSWLVDIGDPVKKNQVLAVIDTPELDAQLDAAKAQLKASEAETKVREADAEFARTTYERWSGSAKGVVSEQEREDKKAGYASAIAKLHAAQARVNLDQSNVDRLTFMTQYKQVVAPYDGIITARRTDIGDLVTAGSTSNTTPLFEISQYDKVRVFANVPQQASGDARAGTLVKIYAAEYPNQVFEGKVTRTSEAIDPHARTLHVEADIPNPDLKLLPGMYLQMEFRLKSRNYVKIPASALLFRTAGPQVALIQPDNTVKFQDVRIARDNGNSVEVSSGLTEGDRVALNISNQITDGSKVTVKENSKLAAR
ncbi:MAG TPA: efflux RND transporter periplasmic adaptor subunit [Hyphomicrobiales bacterium]|nr:efflux RND transporter periplasmic adaptor subunit [Hyphomicrobiales bacterium]